MSETVTVYKCDKCSTLIRSPRDGLVIHGNIYVADPESIGGLIGNNFPSVTEGEGYTSKDVGDAVKMTVMCNTCFFKAVFPDNHIVNTRSGILE